MGMKVAVYETHGKREREKMSKPAQNSEGVQLTKHTVTASKKITLIKLDVMLM